MNIHPTAIIDKNAELSEDVQVGPYTLIEKGVKIGRGVKIYSHVHILSSTHIGDNCQIHMGAVLGHSPQIRKAPEACGGLVIGERNVFREYCSIHCSSQKDGITSIGNDNYLMGFSHIAHDCSIGNYNTICNGALIAGHAMVEDYTFISGNVTVHQFCRIGKFSMTAGLARVSKDIPPYMLVKGDSLVWAINSIGLRRAQFSVQLRLQIKKAFKILYTSGLNVQQAVEQLEKLDRCPEIEHLIDFVRRSQRGICAHKSKKDKEYPACSNR